MITWLGEKLALAIHRMQIAEHGGEDGVRDLGLLESALARARNIDAYEPNADTARLAAAYAFGIIKNHPFVDGNRRTGYVVMETFLVLNRHALVATEDEKYPVVLGIADGTVSEDDLSEWLRGRIVKAE